MINAEAPSRGYAEIIENLLVDPCNEVGPQTKPPPYGFCYAKNVSVFEEELFNKWMDKLAFDLL